MKDKINPEYITGCRARLEALGFELAAPNGLWATWDGRVLIDFSGVNQDMYVIHAMRMAYEAGLNDGKTLIRVEIKQLLGL